MSMWRAELLTGEALAAEQANFAFAKAVYEPWDRQRLQNAAAVRAALTSARATGADRDLVGWPYR